MTFTLHTQNSLTPNADNYSYFESYCREVNYYFQCYLSEVTAAIKTQMSTTESQKRWKPNAGLVPSKGDPGTEEYMQIDVS